MKTNAHYADGKRDEKVVGFKVLENECVWMRAGVVNFRMCENDYDCFNCPFDRAMRTAMEAQSPPKGRGVPLSWAQEMRKKYMGTFKPCRYFLTGQIGPPGNCSRDYDCDECPIDLTLEYKPLMKTITTEKYATEVPAAGKTTVDEETDSEVLEKECVWMRAGIISFHLCETDYDCYHCMFDRSMRAAMSGESPPEYEAKSLAWEDEIQDRYEPVMGQCIHFLAGLTGAPEKCSNNYECSNCSVHHDLTYYKKAEPMPLGELEYKSASGFKVADGYYYHYGHSWVHIIHGGCVRVGIDDFMAKIFGQAGQIKLPQEGASLKQGNVAWVMARNGHRAPVQSPLSGRVLAVNYGALEHPEISHDDPYEKGWLFHLEPSFLRREFQGLYFGEECLQWMEKENQSLLRLLGPEYERLAATGAEAVNDLFGSFPEIGWNRLVRTFLHTGEKR